MERSDTVDTDPVSRPNVSAGNADVDGAIGPVEQSPQHSGGAVGNDGAGTAGEECGCEAAAN
jgi:hypothetical protein